MSHKPIKNNIIRFPVERIKNRRQTSHDLPETPEIHDEWNDDEYMDLEDKLWAKENFEELIRLYSKQLTDSHDDDFARFSLAQAYFFNDDYEKALNLFHDLHTKSPDDVELIYFIVEALLASGKTDKDFDWVAKPDFLHLNKKVISACYNMLKPGYKACSIDHLYNIFYEQDYLMFTEDQLLAVLERDSRFLVTRPSDSEGQAEVEIARRPAG
jgi:tetratricopeptide (TPR) repeat protein